MSKITFKENDSTLDFTLNPWDSKPLGRSCYELKMSLGEAPATQEAIIEFMRINKFETVTYRAGPNDIVSRRYIQSLGFIHVELQLNCRLSLSQNMEPTRQMGNLRLAQDKDRSRVSDIAKSIFLDTRFKYIPDLAPEKIGYRFSNWVNQLQDEFSEFAYVLEVNEKIVGFFFSKPSQHENELYAALGGIAYDSKAPYGIYLYPAVMTAYYHSGIKNMVSAIAADNMGALNLWANLGTRFPEAVDFFMWNIESQT